MLNLDDAFGITPPPNGRIIRNLVQGANYVQSHILHFFHLAALDFVKGPETAPFIPRYDNGDTYRLPKEVNDTVVGHYITALDMRRKAHEMGVVFGGKMPHTTVYTPGGVTDTPTPEKIELFKQYLTEFDELHHRRVHSGRPGGGRRVVTISRSESDARTSWLTAHSR